MSNQTEPISLTSGYNSATKTYHSLRTTTSLPPSSQTSLSITSYIFSLLRLSPHFSPSHPLLINSASDSSLSYSSFLLHVTNLSTSLPPIPARHVALILSPPNFHVPVLYFSLLSLNVVVSPANPLSTPSELTHLVSLSKPAVIFTVSSLLPKLASVSKNISVILIDSPEFDSMVTRPSRITGRERVEVSQDDSAVILYSSGTTGRVKGVELTHRNLIALISGYYHRFQEEDEEMRKIRAITLVPLPLFHVFGFSMLLRAVTLSETLVMMDRFDFEKMLAAVERYKVLAMPVSPPLIVALAKSELVDKYDVSSLRSLGCGGAPLGKDVAERFKARFPDIEIVQVRLRTSEPPLLSY